MDGEGDLHAQDDDVQERVRTHADCVRELRSLQKMSVFIILIYARAWFEAPLAADAPFNDLTLFHDLHKYRNLNSKISETTVKTFKRHFWYLGTNLVGLALFSDKVTIEEKTKMVEKLAIDKDLDKKRWTTALQDPSSVTLSDLVTKESLFSFTELKLDSSFLQSPVLSWKENEAYNQDKETVQHLAVTNDPAERAIKLITDYSQILTKDESDRQALLQAVERHRRLNLNPN
ncbi:hypothetical protein GWK47_019372 [Chionoecetes opilio]|uniref:Uncharacterized protein n=1 Tax=Chionoecetes opilio TaxID=41210 RepID=A0A8J5CLB0_CHIOP|nr:hypothetical protein GWK47_019372 [Chionoecetes opilio]